MDIQLVSKDPQAFIASVPTDASVDHSALSQAAENILSLKQKIKLKTEEKKETSSKFKKAKGDQEALKNLKLSMQSISSELKELENKKQNIEQHLVEICTQALPTKPEKPELPQQFLTNDQASKDLPHAEAVRIEQVQDQDAHQWDEYVAAHSQACSYHRYAWRSIITNSFGHKSFYLVAKIKNEIVGVLPFFWLNSRLFGSFGVSMPFFNYGGPLSNSNAISEQLMQAAANIAEQNEFSHLEIRTTNDSFSWPSESRKVSMILSLPETADTLDADLGAKVRAQAKQADQYAPKVAFGKLELLDDFYRVFSQNMRDLGTPVYGREIFKNILSHPSIDATLVVAYVNKKPVGAAFLIANREMMEIPWASTLKSANFMNINMWMYHRILHHCIEREFQFFDFGRSTKDAGTYRFKKQWGAKPVEHYWYSWRPANAEAPSLNPDNPKFKLMIATWKKLPLLIANAIGPHIVKNLP